jgi:hypothetical protein
VLGLADRDVEALLHSPFVSQLTSLDIRWSTLSDLAIAHLLSSPHLKNLRTLSIEVGSSSSATESSLQAFEKAAFKLKSLHVNLRPITDRGLRSIVEARSLDTLGILEIKGAENVDWRLVENTSFGHHLRKIDCLDSQRSPARNHYLQSALMKNVVELGPARPAIYAGAPNLGALEVISFQRAQLLRSELKPFLDNTTPRNVRCLDLAQNFLMEEGAALLAQSPRCESLVWLDLTSNVLHDESAKALADSPFLGNLEILKLGHNSITDAGAEVLLNSGRLRNLRRLEMNGASITDSMKARLREFARERFWRSRN